jgi:hypothetical protein
MVRSQISDGKTKASELSCSNLNGTVVAELLQFILCALLSSFYKTVFPKFIILPT